MMTLYSLLHLLLNIYLFFLMLRALLDMIPVFSPTWRPTGVLLVLANFIFAVTDPPLNFLRRYVPPLRVGMVAFDMAFLVLFFTIAIVQRFILPLIFMWFV